MSPDRPSRFRYSPAWPIALLELSSPPDPCQAHEGASPVPELRVQKRLPGVSPCKQHGARRLAGSQTSSPGLNVLQPRSQRTVGDL